MNNVVVCSAVFACVMAPPALGIQLSNEMLDADKAVLLRSTSEATRSQEYLLALAVNPRHRLVKHPPKQKASASAGESSSTGASAPAPSPKKPAN